MMSKLEKCICGGEANKHPNYVICRSCGITGPDIDPDGSGWNAVQEALLRDAEIQAEIPEGMEAEYSAAEHTNKGETIIVTYLRPIQQPPTVREVLAECREFFEKLKAQGEFFGLTMTPALIGKIDAALEGLQEQSP